MVGLSFSIFWWKNWYCALSRLQFASIMFWWSKNLEQFVQFQIDSRRTYSIKKYSRQSKIMTWTRQLLINCMKTYENYFDWRNMDVVSFGAYNFYWRQSADSLCCFLFKGSILLYIYSYKLQIGKLFGITGWLHLKIPDICGNIFTINLLVAISTLSQVFSATKSKSKCLSRTLWMSLNVGSEEDKI